MPVFTRGLQNDIAELCAGCVQLSLRLKWCRRTMCWLCTTIFSVIEMMSPNYVLVVYNYCLCDCRKDNDPILAQPQGHPGKYVHCRAYRNIILSWSHRNAMRHWFENVKHVTFLVLWRGFRQPSAKDENQNFLVTRKVKSYFSVIFFHVYTYGLCWQNERYWCEKKTSASREWMNEWMRDRE